MRLALALLSFVSAHLRHPLRAGALALFSMTRDWPSLIGVTLRRLFLKRLFAACGPGLTVGSGAIVVGFDRIRIGAGVDAMSALRLDAAGEGTITIGDKCSMNSNVQICSGPRNAIVLGEAVLLGHNVVLRNGNHVWSDPDRLIRDQGHSCDDIVIEDDVWLCANTVVLGGAHIGHGSVVTPGSVVRPGDYEPMKVYAGNPAAEVAERR